ncbi:metallophosphoesterase [Glycomyces buryatensis]|uniref:Metallophosphoesterase n=1 Tax=Glycomyces buryatensis TaxID=2570927 RepID=A0A4S8Q9H0_9ACTN|nr:metallophosphoesterase [Glycomyces buryatensis]THV40091.1 metallophosphoesterase [Glycomyces buryatensis]
MSHRPSDLSPEELRFIPQRPVRWMSPRTLAETAARLGLARLLGGYLDKREIFGSRPQEVFEHDTADELWLDYVADIGDGFNATYSVAYMMAQHEVEAAGLKLPRGSVLVMGGDEVYPAGDWREYEHRMKGPYEAANPGPPEDPENLANAVSLYAIPGNHDWFDGLTAFGRQFLERRRIGGYRTAQQRSYFALRLPRNWWLFAVDAQFDAHLDQSQVEYFKQAAQQMQPGDQVILCVPQPSWVWTEDNPRSYDRIDHFIRDIVADRQAEVPLILTGDRHHYAHYTEVDGARHLVTAGGGGAYLSPTHNLPETLTAPRKSVSEPDAEQREFQLTKTYPTKPRSLGYALGIFGRLPLLNRSFVLLTAVIMLITTVSILEGSGTFAAVATVIIAGGVGFAHPGQGRRRVKHYLLGIVHGIAQLSLAWAGAQALRALPSVEFWTYVAYLPVAGLVSTWLVGLYLVVANRFGVNANELFAGMSIQDQKCFLRIHIGPEGATVYPIGLDRVGRDWEADPEGAPGTSWVKPSEPLRARLIEPGFKVPHPIPDREQAPIPKQSPMRRLMAQAGEWFDRDDANSRPPQ